MIYRTRTSSVLHVCRAKLIMCQTQGVGHRMHDRRRLSVTVPSPAQSLHRRRRHRNRALLTWQHPCRLTVTRQHPRWLSLPLPCTRHFTVPLSPHCFTRFCTFSPMLCAKARVCVCVCLSVCAFENNNGENMTMYSHGSLSGRVEHAHANTNNQFECLFPLFRGLLCAEIGC